MARVTVEDCMDKVDSRFDLVVFASKRAREIASGSPITVDRDNDKNAVVALREIDKNHIDLKQMFEILVRDFQKAIMADNFEDVIQEDILEHLKDASEWHKDQPNIKEKELEDVFAIEDETIKPHSHN